MSFLKLTLPGAALLLAALSILPAAQAFDTPSAPVKKSAKAKAKKAAPVEQTEEPLLEEEPDTAGSLTTEFNCELGNKITIYSNTDDNEHIALRWKKRLHRLTRVGTTTGAQRFENKIYGLIWIGIPAKGMLLDSKLNRQLANECKDAEQMKPASAEAPAAPAPKML
jgi:hypothetical protein